MSRLRRTRRLVISVLLALYPVTLLTGFGETYSLRWHGKGGPSDGYKSIKLVFDGKQYELDEFRDLVKKHALFKKGDTIEIHFPDSFDIESSSFAANPIAGIGILGELLRADVTVIYKLRGHVVPRRTLLVHFGDKCFFLDCASFFLDGKLVGKGEAGLRGLTQEEWVRNSYLTIRFVHAHPEYAGLPVLTFPPEVLDSWLTRGVKLESVGEEFVTEQ